MSTDMIDPVRSILSAHTPAWHTCDFSIGGIFMWTDYFHYEGAIADDTLFIRGVNENDLSSLAFSLPVGALPLDKSLDILSRYCRENGCDCVLSAVPAPAVDIIDSVASVKRVEALPDWGDYLYDITRLASLSGKAMNKKRNHVNRFEAENPGYTFEPLTPELIPAVTAFYENMAPAPDKAMSADYERLQVLEVLRHHPLYGFEGAVLSTPADGIVAFTMGEVIADTLYVHIEKMRHDVAGAGETVNCLFARMMSERYGSNLLYVNREEDAGDEGLRKAKLSYHPCQVIPKFNVIIR